MSQLFDWFQAQTHHFIFYSKNFVALCTGIEWKTCYFCFYTYQVCFCRLNHLDSQISRLHCIYFCPRIKIQSKFWISRNGKINGNTEVILNECMLSNSLKMLIFQNQKSKIFCFPLTGTKRDTIFFCLDFQSNIKMMRNPYFLKICSKLLNYYYRNNYNCCKFK